MDLNKWQQVCKFVDPLIRANVPEVNVYQKIFEAILEIIFDWDPPHKRSHVPVPRGSAGSSWDADIVLDGDDFGIVIEMKKAGVKLGEDEAGQIKTYMRMLENKKYRYKYGLIVGKQIKVFYDDGDFREVAGFDFNPGNSDGKALFEILDRNVCSEEKLKKYIFTDRSLPPSKSTPKSASASTPSPFNFLDLITHYNGLYGDRYPTDERGGENYEVGWFYRHINIKDWGPEPDEIFYEFYAPNKKNEKVKVMFHIERRGYEKVNQFIKEKYEGKNEKLGNLNKYEIKYKKAIYGRLVVDVPYSDGYENMAQCMIDLIELTKDEIRGVLQGIT
jgi:hypothetical protein